MNFSAFHDILYCTSELPTYWTRCLQVKALLGVSVFLFLVITVLLNLLITQMSDTYTNVQSDAQRHMDCTKSKAAHYFCKELTQYFQLCSIGLQKEMHVHC